MADNVDHTNTCAEDLVHFFKPMNFPTLQNKPKLYYHAFPTGSQLLAARLALTQFLALPQLTQKNLVSGTGLSTISLKILISNGESLPGMVNAALPCFPHWLTAARSQVSLNFDLPHRHLTTVKRTQCSEPVA